MPTTVRKAVIADLDRIVDERLAFLADVRGPGYQAPSGFDTATRDFIEAELGAERLHTWLADIDGDPAGIVSMVLRARPPVPDDLRAVDAYIINMHVQPLYQRRGIGRLLLDTALAAGRDIGVRTFQLHSTDDGRALYESAGFAPEANWMELPAPR